MYKIFTQARKIRNCAKRLLSNEENLKLPNSPYSFFSAYAMLAAPLISIMASMPAKPCDDRHAAPIVDINHRDGGRDITNNTTGRRPRQERPALAGFFGAGNCGDG